MKPAKIKRMKVAQGKLLGIQNHPNISITGSVRGMRNLYWGDAALIVRCGSYYYNVPRSLYEQAT
jgi:hypothetical protein